MAVLGLSGRAQAAPYVHGAGQNISINHNLVGPGGQADVTVNGAVPGHNISFYINSRNGLIFLGTSRANASGVASLDFKVPAGFTGKHTITAKDPLTGDTWSISLTIVSAAAAAASSTSSGNSGGLPNTGAAVMGLGVLALILLGGGATLLLLGRRRVRSSH